MNKTQKIITGVGVFVFVLSLLCAPWDSVTLRNDHPHHYYFQAPIWFTPDATYGACTLQFGTLIAEWVGLGVVCGALMFFCKTKRQS